MKKKIYNTIIVILIMLYLAAAFHNSNKKWQNGISKEEITKENLLIW